MDGSDGKMSRSLQYRLSAWLSLVIVCVALAAGVFSFVSAYQEAIELQDNQLAQMAALIGLHRLPVTGGEAAARADDDPEFNFVVRFLPQREDVEWSLEGGLSDLAEPLAEGIQTVEVGGASWRVFVRSLGPGDRVAVGQRTIVREEIARDSAFRTVMPLLVLIPAMVILVGYLTRRMFGPLKEAARGT